MINDQQMSNDGKGSRNTGRSKQNFEKYDDSGNTPKSISIASQDIFLLFNIYSYISN